MTDHTLRPSSLMTFSESTSTPSTHRTFTTCFITSSCVFPSLIHRPCEFRSFSCGEPRLSYPDDRSLVFGLPDAEIARARPVWVVVPLPAPRHVVDLIVVPGSG
jgi:hypothetical protein